MRKFMFCLLVVLIMSDGEAANWVKLHENGNAKLLLDKQSITQKDALSRAWVKIEYKTPQTNTDSADKTYNLSKLLWYFDCNAQKSATSQVFQYLNTETVFSAAIDVKSAEFIEPVPETELDLAMRYVCARNTVKSENVVATAGKPLVKAEAEKKAEAKPAEVEKALTEAKPEVKAEQEKPEPIKTAKENISKENSSKVDKHAAHWAYEGKEGPEHWAKLKPEFVTCEAGRNQSPINIEEAIDAPLKPLKGIQKVAAKEILNNGHTVQANFKFGNMLLLDDVPYQMKQVHFHAPSENTIKGKSYPLEAHFVHADKNGNLSVIGVMFKEGKANPGLEKLWAQMPKEAGAPIPLKAKVSASEMIPENRDYYRFSGSLTTPPCSEGVRWLLLKTPMTASKEQIEAFEEVMRHHNNRPVQPLNGRVVVE